MDDTKYELPEQLILARQADLLRTFYKFAAGLTFIALMLIVFLPGFATQENVLEPFVRNVFVILSIGVLYWLVETEHIVAAIFGTVGICCFFAVYSIYQESPGNMQMMTLIIFPICVAGLLPSRQQFWLVFALNFILMLFTFWLIITYRGVEIEYRSFVTVGLLMTLIALLIDVMSSSYRRSLTVTFNQLTEIRRAREQLVKLDADLEAAVTDRLAAENRHNRIAKTGRLALEVAGAGAIEIDQNTNAVTMTETFVESFGFDQTPSNLDELSDTIHPSERARFKTIFQQSEHPRDRLEGDFRINTAEPNYWLFVLESMPNHQMNGVVVDVTNRVLEQLKQVEEGSKQHESQRLESLGLLAGSIAHDFNNLLHVIMLNADLARQDLKTDSRPAVSLDRLMTTVNRAAELCNELLSYSGRGQIKVEPFDIKQLVAEMKDLLEISTPKGVSINLDTDGSNPTISGDITQVRQVIMNLITNAGEAIGSRSDGRIDISVSQASYNETALRDSGFIEELTAGDYVVVSVIDNGAGMDSETRKRMFDPFFSTRDSGHGLGLSAVLGIVRGHGGTIRVESTPGSGTRITVLFPLDDSPPSASPANPAVAMFRGAEKRILFADDESEIRELAKTVLEDTGYHVIEAVDGQQAIDLFKREHEDLSLVILDLMMPNRTGLEAYFEISDIDASVPVVFSSGFNESDLMQQLPPKTRAVFLKKPYLANDLRLFVEGLIGARP